MTGRNAGPPGERSSDAGGPSLEVHHKLDGAELVDGDDHAAVTEPLGDSNTTLGCDLAHHGAEG